MKILSALFLLLLLTNPAVAKWSTLKFEVVEGNPYLQIKGSSSNYIAASTLSDNEIIAIEKYLSRVAKALEEFGFPEPNISTRSPNGAFRIYVGGAFGSEGPLGVYSDSRNFAVQTVILNPENKMVRKGSKLLVRGWQTLAHELFHAIQDNCAYQKNSSAAALWISEGTADAIGYYCAENFAPLKSFPGTTDDYGARAYYQKLVSPKRNNDNESNRRGYRTMSFWRYLAQVEQMSRAPADATKPTIFGEDETFYYLARLLKTPMKGPDEDLTSLRWLDNFLKKDHAFGGGLYKQFPEFLTTYGDTKYHPKLKKPPVFLDTVLGPVEQINSVSPGKVVKQTIIIPPIAGERVAVDLKTNFPIVISAKAYRKNSQTSSPLYCKNIQLGLLGLDKQQRPGVVNKLPNGEGVATWTLALPQGKSTLLVTNSAPQTVDNQGLRFELSFFQGSLAANSPAGSVNGVIGPDVAYRKSKTLLAFSHPEEYKTAAKMLAFSQNQSDQLFSPRYEQGSPQDILKAVQIDTEKLENISRNNGLPHIEIPGLEPDQTGTFNNAIITHKHPEHGRLQTVRFEEGTQNRVGDGQVVITEHTPLYLRGSYSGVLRGKRMKEYGTTSGEFFIPLPLLKRDEIEQDGEHISALNQAHFLTRTRQTGRVDPENPEMDLEPIRQMEKPSTASSTASAAGSQVQGESPRDALLRRYRTLMEKMGASEKEMQMQMKLVEDMSDEDLREMLLFMERSLK